MLIMPHHYHHPHFITTIFTTISLSFSLLPALPVLPNPDPAPITLQQQQQFHPTPPTPTPTTTTTTIPSFPEQTAVSSTCPLHLPAPLFPAVKSACGGGGQLYKDRCCPVLAVWLYSAYIHTALLTTSKTPPTSSESYYDMPLLPDDSETCIDGLEKKMKDNGVDLIRLNETCDVVYCFCGIELHPLSCPQAFGVHEDGSLRLVDQGKVNKLEKDCRGSDGISKSNDNNGGCSKCLKSLYKLKEGQRLEGNTTKWERRTGKMRSRDCELMGLTWLLNKDRDTYISTVTQVMRALMMDTEGSDPRSCSLSSDGMPLAVDSVAINGNDHSSAVALQFPVVYFISILLFVVLILCTG